MKWQVLLFFLFFPVQIVFSGLKESFSNADANVAQDENLQVLLQQIMVNNLLPFKCVVIVTDTNYERIFSEVWFRKFGPFISFLMIRVGESEDLLSPDESTQTSLYAAKTEGCQMYIILMSNGMQITRLLRFGDKYRVINTWKKFILLYDNRLFDRQVYYVWKRIVNVIFLRQYGGQRSDNTKKNMPWFEITTVPFPSPITSVLVPRRLDLWTAKSGFRKKIDLFRDKTSDFRNQTLRVAVFPHIPGTAKSDVQLSAARAVIGSSGSNFNGAEIEILQTVAAVMNFKFDIYEPENVATELWGERNIDGKYTGLIGEMVYSHADIALGDLYYTPYIMDLMDLSVPYNTECLTFLTPEALFDNSWKTLILPFKPLMWAALLICLFICGAVFYSLARFHEALSGKTEKVATPKCRKKIVLTLSKFPQGEKLEPNVKYNMMRAQYNVLRKEEDPVGLYQFTEPINSVLYTYSMLLLVSLPKLPTGWSLRMLTGWYWLYCLLLVVAYRASMTAILARPTPRMTIDRLQSLVDSRLQCGGWGEINRIFFKNSTDATTRKLADKFTLVRDFAGAVDRVADGTFALYENAYFLKEALVKRQLRFQESFQAAKSATNLTVQEARDWAKEDRILHIMTDCVIKMPISIGLQKNSPLKSRMDHIIRRVLEAGLIKKWLDDVMAPILNAEIQSSQFGNKAIMDMKKMFGALVALFIGYLCGILALFLELLKMRLKTNNRHNNVLEMLLKLVKITHSNNSLIDFNKADVRSVANRR